MDKKKALERLNQALVEVSGLRQLPYDNQKYQLWLNKVRTLIENALGQDDYDTFKRAPSTIPSVIHVQTEYPDTDFQQERYRKILQSYETALKSIIQKYEILGMEEKPRTLKYQIPGVDTKSNIPETPVQLFDKMQFHPKVVEASSSCFITGNCREAILNAFISLIDYIKEISGLDLDGDDLMNNAFSFNYDREQRKITKYPLIRINELKNKTDRDEQQGLMFLCKGAAAFIRNPKAHKLVVQTNPLHTLEYLAFGSMLFKQLDNRIQLQSEETSS